MLWCAVVSSAGAGQPNGLIEPSYVASALHFDRQLRFQDITESARFRNSNVLWSGDFVSEDKTLPITTIVVSRGKTELTDEQRQKFLVAAKKEIRLPGGKIMPPVAMPIRLADGAEGFSCLAGFGPGGISYAAVVTTPDGRYDIAMALGFAANDSEEKDVSPPLSDLQSRSQSDVAVTLESALQNIYPTLAKNISSRLAESPPATFPPPLLSPSATSSKRSAGSSDKENYENQKLSIAVPIALAVSVFVAFVYLRRSKK